MFFFTITIIFNEVVLFYDLLIEMESLYNTYGQLNKQWFSKPHLAYIYICECNSECSLGHPKGSSQAEPKLLPVCYKVHLQQLGMLSGAVRRQVLDHGSEIPTSVLLESSEFALSW